jgi:hypothetical protein
VSLDLAQPSAVAALQSELQRRAVIQAVQEHPEWRLADLDHVMASGSPRAKLLGGITLAELQSTLEPLRLEAPINSERLARARTLSGSEFDAVVLEIIDEAGDWVRSGYVKARAGGPRWKVQQSLGRLVNAGRLKRQGITSATEYHVGRRAS